MKIHRNVETLAVIIILITASVLRFANLSAVPGWYTDEGTHLELARHLAQGEVRYFAITHSALLFAKPPLFDLILSALIKIAGLKMITLRSLTAGLGVLAVGLVYGIMRRVVNQPLPSLASALMLAIYPPAVLYSRFGFSYALLVPLALVLMYALFQYRSTMQIRWMLLAGSMIGIGTTSDFLMLTFLAPLCLYGLSGKPAALVGGLAVALLIPLVLAGLALMAEPMPVVFDLKYTFGRVSSADIGLQLTTLTTNIAELARDGWIVAGFAGLTLARPARLRWIMLAMVVAPLVLIGRTMALTSLSAYYLIPFMPFLAIGTSELLCRVGGLVGKTAQRFEHVSSSQWENTVTALFILGIAGWSAATTAQNFERGFATPIDSFLLDPGDVQSTIDFMNAMTNPEEVIIASPGLGWALDAPTADFQMAIAVQGIRTPHLPPDIPPERWAFDPQIDHACYVVVDPVWRNWASIHVPTIREWLDTFESWPIVYQAGQITVHKNPACQRSS